MKKLFFIAFTIIFLTSCGPHRMSCGAKGICSASEKPFPEQSRINRDK